MRNHPYMAPRNEAWVSRCCFRDRDSQEYCRKAETDPIHKGQFLPSGTAGVVTCPFQPCGKTVTVRNSTPFLIEQHNIVWLADPVIAGMPCPGSLMPHPITAEVRALLDQQAQDMRDHIRRSNEKEDKLPPNPSTGKMAGPSQNLHQPGRLGREPEPRASEWQLGGRVDEDVHPASEDVKGRIPFGVLGQSVGRNSDVSVSQGVSSARVAVNKAEEAYQTLCDALSQINGAKAIVVELLGDGTGETLTSWLAALNQSGDAILTAQGKIGTANEHGDRFISNLMS